MRGTGPRLAPLPEDQWGEDILESLQQGRAALLSDELQEALDSRDVSRLARVLPNAITTMLYNPPLAGAWLVFNGALLRGLSLPARAKELLVLRVAWRTGSVYEWLQHVRMAPRYEISEEEVQAIATEELGGTWIASERALLAAADQLVEKHTVDDATWNLLTEHLDERQLLEVPFVVGAYVTLAMVFNALRIQSDPQYQTVSAPPIRQMEV